MMVSRDARVTAAVRLLRVGDKFTEADGNWEVTRVPEKVDASTVRLYVKPFPNGQRSRAYLYDIDARVDIIQVKKAKAGKTAA